MSLDISSNSETFVSLNISFQCQFILNPYLILRGIQDKVVYLFNISCKYRVSLY